MVLATKKNCQRVLAASLRVVSAMTGNPPLDAKTSICPFKELRLFVRKEKELDYFLYFVISYSFYYFFQLISLLFQGNTITSLKQSFACLEATLLK